MPNLLFDNKVNRVDLVSEGSCSVADIIILKGKELNCMPEQVQAILDKMLPEHVAALKTYIADVEKACNNKIKDVEKECCDKLKKAEDEKMLADKNAADKEEELQVAKNRIALLEGEVAKSKPEVLEDEIFKSMPAAAQALFTKMKAENEAMIAKVKADAEAAIESKAIAKAKELSVLPIEQNDLVAILKNKPDEKIITLLENIAKAAEKSDLFKSIGSSSTDNNAGSAEDIIEAKAADIAKSKNITIEKARVIVYKENPELYAKLQGGK